MKDIVKLDLFATIVVVCHSTLNRVSVGTLLAYVVIRLDVAPKAGAGRC